MNGEPAIGVLVVRSPAGPLLARASERALLRLDFVDPGERVDPAGGVVRRSNALLERLAEELAAYFAGEPVEFATPVELAGTPFQRRVWEALLRIPAGETRSYADVARAIGAPKAVRAVGAANGANPVSILVPCHRVVRTGGALGGYGGGLHRKRWLLEHEARTAGRRLFV